MHLCRFDYYCYEAISYYHMMSFPRPLWMHMGNTLFRVCVCVTYETYAFKTTTYARRSYHFNPLFLFAFWLFLRIFIALLAQPKETNRKSARSFWLVYFYSFWNVNCMIHVNVNGNDTMTTKIPYRMANGAFHKPTVFSRVTYTSIRTHTFQIQ